MIIFFYGADAYRLKKAKEEVLNHYKAKYKSGVNLFHFNFSEAEDIAKCKDALKTSSFFNEHKLIAYRGIFDKKQSAETLAEVIKDHGIVADSNVTLLITENLPEKSLISVGKDLFKTLSGKGDVVKIFESLIGAELLRWIRKEFEARGCLIGDDAIRVMVDLAGNDSWALISEIDKLSAYRRGTITAKEVELLVSPDIDLNIFNLTDAIAARTGTRSLEILFRELKTGRDPYYLLAMITYQFRNLLSVKDLQGQNYSESEITRKTKLSPFAVKKAFKSPYRFDEAVEIYKRILALDTGFKAGRIDLEDELYSLVI